MVKFSISVWPKGLRRKKKKPADQTDPGQQAGLQAVPTADTSGGTAKQDLSTHEPAAEAMRSKGQELESYAAPPVESCTTTTKQDLSPRKPADIRAQLQYQKLASQPSPIVEASGVAIEQDQPTDISAPAKVQLKEQKPEDITRKEDPPPIARGSDVAIKQDQSIGVSSLQKVQPKEQEPEDTTCQEDPSPIAEGSGIAIEQDKPNNTSAPANIQPKEQEPEDTTCQEDPRPIAEGFVIDIEQDQRSGTSAPAKVQSKGKEPGDVTYREDLSPILPPRQPNCQLPIGLPLPGPSYHLLQLPSELLLYIIEDLVEERDTLVITVTCKALRDLVPKLTVHTFNERVSRDEKLEILKAFAPRYTAYRNHPHPYLCIDCLKWHPLSLTAIWPSWQPENRYNSFHDFLSPHRSRVCVRNALSTQRWSMRLFLDKDMGYLLCNKCYSPYSIAQKSCSWRCDKCGKCTIRKGWTALCEACTDGRGGGEKPMKYRGVADPVNPVAAVLSKDSSSASARAYGGTNFDVATAGRKPPVKSTPGNICSMCLGMRSWDPHSKETCRCFDSARDRLPGNTRMMYDGH